MLEHIDVWMLPDVLDGVAQDAGLICILHLLSALVGPVGVLYGHFAGQSRGDRLVAACRNCRFFEQVLVLVHLLI